MATDDTSTIAVDIFFRAIPESREARWDLMKRFFAGWYGPLVTADGYGSEAIRAAEERLSISLPTGLREWYLLAGKRKEVWSCVDHFLSPEDLRIEQDELIIGMECQGAVRWSLALAAMANEDPIVWLARCDSDHWVEASPRVSTFALSQMLLGAKFSDSTRYFANGQATDEALAAIRERYQKLDFGDLIWPPHPTRLFGADDLIIETEAETWIWISGKSAGTFRAAVDLIAGLSVELEEDSRLD